MVKKGFYQVIRKSRSAVKATLIDLLFSSNLAVDRMLNGKNAIMKFIYSMNSNKTTE